MSSLQQGLQDSSSKCQTLEENNLSLRHTLSDMEYRLKELEYCKRNLEQENKNLRIQVLIFLVLSYLTNYKTIIVNRIYKLYLVKYIDSFLLTLNESFIMLTLELCQIISQGHFYYFNVLFNHTVFM